MSAVSLYASPRDVGDVRDCLFYHSIDLPGHPTIVGPWDLRKGIARYLGKVDFAGKRVLDVGTASGFLSFHMERQGAEVVSFDLSEAHTWDHVPYAGSDVGAISAQSRPTIRRINNSYWYSHRAFGSRNRVVYGTAYTIPAAIGPVQVGVFGSILQHLRDPFLALQAGLALVKDTAIVAEVDPRRPIWQRWVAPLLSPQMQFLPDARNPVHNATWWMLSPRLMQNYLGVLGFENAKVTYHSQPFEGSARLLYTVVAQRTKPAPVLPALDVRHAAENGRTAL